MRIVGAVVLALCMSGSAKAEVKDGAEIAKAAQKCWALMDPNETKGFSASFDARINDVGRGEFRLRNYQPNTKTGKRIAESAKRTLQKCSPFKGISPGLYRFEMTYEDPFDQ